MPLWTGTYTLTSELNLVLMASKIDSHAKGGSSVVTPETGSSEQVNHSS